MDEKLESVGSHFVNIFQNKLPLLQWFEQNILQKCCTHCSGPKNCVTISPHSAKKGGKGVIHTHNRSTKGLTLVATTEGLDLLKDTNQALHL